MRHLLSYHTIVLLLAATAFCRGQVVINEIMYAPLAPEPEWIELYNIGTADVDVTGWTIHDAGATVAKLPQVRVPARGYLVVTKDTTKLRALRIIGSLLVKATLPTLNNSGDVVVLRDSTGYPVDSLRYAASWGGTGGVSLERRRGNDTATLGRSWGSSISPTGATPGMLNSISPADRDLSISVIGVDVVTQVIHAVVVNAGVLPAEATEVMLYFDADDDGIGSSAELIDRRSAPPLASGDSARLSFIWPRTLTDDEENGLLEAPYFDDERPENNVSSFIARRIPLDTGVVINEIMADPLAINGVAGAEYIEIFNPTERPVPVAGWQIIDGTGDVQATLAVTSLSIASRGYLVIASDSALFLHFTTLRDSENVVLIGRRDLGLNNDGDILVLRNAAGRTVDSLRYEARWHRTDIGESRGIALERISSGEESGDPRNWSSCVASSGGTPGERNSVAVPATSSAATISVEPHTVSPDGDGYEDFTRISYQLTSATSRITLRLLDRQGRPVRTIAGNEPSPADGELIFDGLDDAGQPLPVGIYIVRLESYDEGGGGLVSAQTTLIVARKL